MSAKAKKKPAPVEPQGTPTEATKEDGTPHRRHNTDQVDATQGEHVPNGRQCTERTNVAGSGPVHPVDLLT